MNVEGIPLDISKLCTLEEIEQAFQQVQEDEVKQVDRLELILQGQHILDDQMKSLTKVLPSVEVVESDLNDLCGTIKFTSSLAENISSKVKLLDLAKSQVFKAIQRVDDILDLKTCTDGVKEAMDKKDYEKAAANIHRYLCLDENVIKQSVSIGSESTSINASLEVLKNARHEMSRVVSEQFDIAIESGNEADVEKFFKIFPWLKMEDEGLEKFSTYLSREISKSTKENLKQALNTDSTHSRFSLVFADILELLFEGIARTIEKQQPLVETYYGPGKLFALMKNVQKECDKQANMILHEFLRMRKFDETEQLVRQSMFTPSKKNEENRKIDPRELESLLNEIIMISRSAELYLRFVNRRIKADIEIVYPNQDERDESWTGFQKWIKNCDLSLFIHNVIAKYIVIEECYMKESIQKAIKLDCFEEGNFISSVVDDIFFILRQCIKRSISSYSIDCVCAILNHAVSILETEFKTKLKRTIDDGYTTGGVLDNISSAYTVMQSSFQQGKIQSVDEQTKDQQQIFLRTMNNCEKSSEHVLVLKNSLDNDITKVFHQHLRMHKAKFESCLADLGSLSSQFKGILKMALKGLNDNALKPELKPLVANFLSVSHNITEDEHDNYEANDPWVDEFIFNLQNLLYKFENTLLPNIYEELIRYVVNDIVERLEKSVFKTSFNRLGALFFDKELRSLITYLTSATSWSVRVPFARLNQISTILNLDAVQEMDDYWGPNAGSLTWRLTPAEVRVVLALRVEFKSDEIKKLKL